MRFFFLLLTVAACTEGAEKRTEDAETMIGNLRYIKDHRTGLCFAAHDDGSAFRPIFTDVPCENVKDLLDNPNPP
ncbi:MAG: hypothetical protein WC787_01875 [Patescibacteria group bacterium]|jgi:hypothetical protein